MALEGLILAVANSTNRMKEKMELTQELFERLLDWLNPDRDSAGEKYEEIRRRLIKIFVCRGCIVPEELADQTINRVAIKVPEIAESYVGDRALYFYGVANKIFLEYLRKMPAPLPILPSPASEEAEQRYLCLEQCVEHLSPENRSLILIYYGNDGRDKINARKSLAQQLGIGANALWIRAHRIREALRNCMSKCLTRKKSQEGTFDDARSNGSSKGIT